jgi:hypothetical protein
MIAPVGIEVLLYGQVAWSPDNTIRVRFRTTPAKIIEFKENLCYILIVHED